MSSDHRIDTTVDALATEFCNVFGADQGRLPGGFRAHITGVLQESLERPALKEIAPLVMGEMEGPNEGYVCPELQEKYPELHKALASYF